MSPPKKLRPTEILIGHLDTGVSAAHSALRGKVARMIAIDKEGKATSKEPASPSTSHGTHTAGIICGDPAQGVPGVAPDAQLCVVAISTRGKSLLQLLAGMDALLSFDIRIACMAIGVRKQTPVFAPFLQAFRQKGILPILPIGNSGAGTGHSPGCYPGALAVGAVDAQGNVAQFSGSYGQGDALKPELLAPGVDILSATPHGYTKRRSGTSMACAHVAGVAARLLQARPEATAAEIRQALISTAAPLSPNRQQRSRYGIVQLEAALEAILQPAPSLPEPAEEPLPAFLQTRYLDQRFIKKYERAGEKQELEALILPETGGPGKGQPPIPEGSRRLIAAAAQKSGQPPAYTRYFQHADVAHVRAGRLFFAALLEHPGLFACSAVDVSIFEM